MKKKLLQFYVICSITLFAQPALANAISGSALATGLKNLMTDLTSWMITLSIVSTALVCVYCLIRRQFAGEIDQKKWSDGIIKAICCGVGAVVVSALINVLFGYFQ